MLFSFSQIDRCNCRWRWSSSLEGFMIFLVRSSCFAKLRKEFSSAVNWVSKQAFDCKTNTTQHSELDKEPYLVQDGSASRKIRHKIWKCRILICFWVIKLFLSLLEETRWRRDGSGKYPIQVLFTAVFHVFNGSFTQHRKERKLCCYRNRE